MDLKRVGFLFLGFLLAGLFAGCQLPLAMDKLAPPAGLTIRWSVGEAQARTILPSGYPTPQTFSITLHPEVGSDTSRTGLTGNDWAFHNLTPGLYTISIKGFNEAGALIVQGTGSADTTSSANNTVPIALSYIHTGSGTGQMHLSFPVYAEVGEILATLTLVDPSGGTSTSTLTPTEGGFAYSNTNALVGTYRLFLKVSSDALTAMYFQNIIVFESVDTVGTQPIYQSDFTLTYVPVTGLTLNETSKDLVVGQVRSLTPTVAPATASNTLVIWTSSNTGVATVSQNGVVTAVAPGETTITAASAENSAYSPTCVVTVSYLGVTYFANGATGGVPVDGGEYASGTNATVLGNIGGLAFPGLSFGGWNTEPDGSGDYYAAGTVVTLTSNLVLYARWTTVFHTYNYENTRVPSDVAHGVTSIDYDAGSGILILGTSTVGALYSKDGGATWANLPSAGQHIASVSVSGNTLSVLTANYGTHWMSTDGGDNWTIDGVSADTYYSGTASGSTRYQATNRGVAKKASSAFQWTWFTTADGLGSNTVREVAVSGGSLYAATAGGLSISTDGGTTWTNYGTANGLASSNVSRVSVSGSAIYASTALGLSISLDNGATWVNRDVFDGLGGPVRGVWVGSSLYAATEGGVSVSTNGGETWQTYTEAQGLADDSVYDVAVAGTKIYAVTAGGLSISSNAGASWSPVSSGNGLQGVQVYDVSVDNNTIYAGTERGLSVSTDAGAHWQAFLPSSATITGQTTLVTVRGSSIGTRTNSHFNLSRDGGVSWEMLYPNDGSTIYSLTDFAMTDDALYLVNGGGLWVSHDDSTWQNFTTTDGLEDNSVNTVTVLGSEIYLGTDAGVSISDDGGTNWVNYSSAHGLASGAVIALEVSGSRIYAGTENGLSVSTDSGAHWTTVTTADGLTSNHITSIAASGSVVYVASWGDLVVSTDGGVTWKRISDEDGLWSAGVNRLVISGSRVYAAGYRGLAISQ